jgi:CheY-like chemotaxis protein
MTDAPLILIVEDETDIREMLAYLLQMSGFAVLQARDGLEGVERAAFAQPHAILMDVAMPHMNGLQATRILRAGSRTAEIPIVIFSAYTSSQDRERALAAGANEFVSKPGDLDFVVSRLRHYAAAG